MLGLVETYEYQDVLGRPTKRIRTVQGAAGALKLEEARTYNDTQHTVTVARDIETAAQQSRTETEKYTLDTAGRVLKVERLVDGQNAVDTYQYNERGQVWQQTSPTLAVTERFYDPSGNLVKVVDAENHTTTYQLDDAGRVHVETGPHPDYQCTYEYDALGRLQSKTVAAAGTTPEMSWTYAYDPITHEEKETADLGGKTIVTTRRTNARGRGGTVVVAGQSGSQETTVELDGPWEAQVMVREGAGWEATRSYPVRDDRGRALEEVEAWTSGSASYHYETKAVWNGRTVALTFKDQVDALVEQRTAAVEVDSLGNLVKLTQDEHEDSWGYDAAGMLVKVQPAGVQTPRLYTYEEGLLKKETFGPEETTYSYYPDGRVKRRATPDGREMQYDYCPWGP